MTMRKRSKPMRSIKVIHLDRALSGGLAKQIYVFFLVAVAVFLLLYGVSLLTGISFATVSGEKDRSVWTLLYYFSQEVDVSLLENRWFAYIVNFLGTILLGGILIAAITNYVLSNRNKAERGLLRYRLSNHTVFIGIHESMLPLVRTALNNKGYVAILSEAHLSEAKNRIVSGLKGSIDTDRLIIYHGQRTNPDDLASLCLDKANAVFIFPEPSFSDTDSVNLDVVDEISKLRSANDGKKLKCTAIFQQDAVVACFERSDINEKVKQRLDFTPIIYGEAVTQALLSGKLYGNKFLDRENITADSNKRIHLFIIGLGDIGRALFVQAARQLHFPNFEKVKSAITLIGEQSDIDALKARYREFFAVADKDEKYAYLGDFLDLSIETIPAVNIRDLDSALNMAVDNPDELVTVAVCLENPVDAHAKAISLPRCVYEKKVPVWLYKPDSDSLIRLIKDDKADDAFYSNLIIFGDSGKLPLHKQKDDLVHAQRINCVYVYLHENNGIPPESISPEEEESEWNKLSIRKKWSNFNCAYSIPVKLRSFGGISAADTKNLTEEQVELMARVEHNRWVAENLLGGFRPVTRDEWEKIAEDETHWIPGQKKTLKDYYKDKYMAHVDLCPSERLLPYKRFDVRNNDRAIVKSIHLIES